MFSTTRQLNFKYKVHLEKETKQPENPGKRQAKGERLANEILKHIIIL